MNDSTHLWMSPTEFIVASGSPFSFINSIFDILFSKKNRLRRAMVFSFINSLFDDFFDNAVSIHKLVIRAFLVSVGKMRAGTQ